MGQSTRSSNLITLVFIAIGLAACAPQSSQASHGKLRELDICRSGRLSKFAVKATEGPSSEFFNQTYLVERKAQPGFPTIILVPGGPGVSALADREHILEYHRYPIEAGLVLYDPRGLGCNGILNSIPRADKLFSTKLLAQDLVSLIRDLKEPNLILHGVSYGSMVATMAAHLLNHDPDFEPTAVVLEGAVGRGNLTDADETAGYLKEWKRLKSTFPMKAVKKLSERTPLSGVKAEDWGAWLVGRMVFKYRPDDPNHASGFADENFRDLEALIDGDASDREQLRNEILGASISSRENDPVALAIYKAIVCREISSIDMGPNLDTDFSLVKGSLVPRPAPLCRGVALDRRFDAAAWPIRAPLYYFIGERDVSTPPAGSYYHISQQTLSPRRTVVAVPEAGHVALTTSLNDCAGSVWQSIAKGHADLTASLKTCEFQNRSWVTK